VLQLSGVDVRYGQIQAVHSIDLKVDAGQLVTILGANGAGKSSTLRTIAGLVRPSAGEIRLDGVQIDGLPPERIARLGLSFVPEGRGILTTLTVEENLRVAAIGARATSDFDGRRDDVFKVFPVLGERRKALAGLLSGGEQQQLALGRAMIHKARLLLLEEPSLGLAPLLRDLVFAQIVRLRDQGATVVLVEQDARRALAIADWAFVLNGGRKVLDLPASEALSSYRELEAAYMGSARH
jgi:branched-chain amino acid transport system ATP-binding protein